MAATVIDSLLVTLGLDPSGYKKGAAEAAKSTKAVQDTVKASSEAMVKSLEEVGRSVAVLFLGFETVTGLGKFLASLNNANANLSTVSKNLGLGVHELETWDNAVKLVGGTAQEAQSGLLALNQQLVDFKRGAAAPSPLITLLMRAGIALYDVNGKIRQTPDLLKDLARAYEGVDRATARATMSSAGLSENVINLLLQERTAREATLALAEKNAVATETSTAEAFKFRQEWIAIQERVEKVGNLILTAIVPAIRTLLTGFAEGDELVTGIVGGFKAIAAVALLIKTAILKVVDGFAAIAAAAMALLHGRFSEALSIYRDTTASDKLQAQFNESMAKLFGGEEYTPGVTRAAAANNHNPGNIKAVGDQPRDAKGFRIFGSDAEGVAAIGHQLDLYRGRGINTIQDIVDTYAPAGDNPEANRAAYRERMARNTGKGIRDLLSDADRDALVRSIIEQEGVIRGSAKISALMNGNASALMAARGGAATPGLDRGQASTGAVSTTTVTVGPVTVNTQATDAAGVARDLGAALQRKGVLSQADAGMS